MMAVRFLMHNIEEVLRGFYSHGKNGLIDECDTPLRLSSVEAVGAPADDMK